MKILVADQTGDLAPACIIFLAYWGHEVAVVGDGLQALRKARSWQPDLVVAPVALDRMDGLTLAAALRAAGKSCPAAVALAGPRDDDAARERALALGAVAYLETPLAVVALANAVARVEEARRRPAPGSATRRRGAA
jgi:two-component system response regulator MprA